MNFTDDIVYKNAYSVYGFIGQLLCGGVRRHRTETVFTDDFFTRNLMCSMQAKLPVFGSHLKGKMPANAIALGPRIRAETVPQFADLRCDKALNS